MNEDVIAILIKRANLVFDKISNQILTPYDLTNTQFKIVMRLFKEPSGTVRQIDLERYFSMTNPTVTGILQNLEKKGLVERVMNPADGRSKVIMPTKKALDRKEDLFRLADSLERNLTKNLTGEEQVQLAGLLKKVIGEEEMV